MAFVADLHIHSKYAQACSGALNIPNLAEWAAFKGINLVGTGDCLHPIYLQELKRDLKDEGNGTYSNGNTKFILSTEVACIYSEQGGGRRIHMVILLPSLDEAFKLNEVMTKQGAKLGSDGRPVIGMSVKKLCEIVFQVSPKAILIPAHVWTPWFGLYGSKSGYDKFSDCFGDFSNEVFAIETGLSSEPAMNWRIGDLDNKSIVSFSDLHSLPRLGRECTIFGGELSFENLRNALKNENIRGTIEFFPEEGKYHYSGHRNCGIVYSPEELEKNGKICPKCHRELTIGVMQRIEELATRSINDLRLTINEGVTKSQTFPKRPGFRMLIQLEEIIAESIGSSVSSQKTKDEYKRLVTTLDNELKILTKTNIDLIAMAAGDKLAEGIKRVRENSLTIEPGYDNTYGVVKIWNDAEEKSTTPEEQMGLF
jgi:uncharacterized protein (TIGR00375 family)